MSSITPLLSSLAEEGIPFYKMWPNFSLECPDTPENREALINQVSELYGTLMRERPVCGVGHDPFLKKRVVLSFVRRPTEEKVREFVLRLKRIVIKTLDDQREFPKYVTLDTKVNNSRQFLLDEAMKAAGINNCNSDSFFPYGSASHISASEGKLKLDVTLLAEVNTTWRR